MFFSPRKESYVGGSQTDATAEIELAEWAKAEVPAHEAQEAAEARADLIHASSSEDPFDYGEEPNYRVEEEERDWIQRGWVEGLTTS